MTSTFIHRFEPGTDPTRPPLLLLHGTGGDENDLIPFGRAIAPGSALLSPRGRVLEQGMPRFFRRLAEGVFDEADLRLRAAELADFVTQSRAIYNLPAPIAVGFSNGANVAAALLMLQPDILAGAVLLRAMVPFVEPQAVDLAGKPVLLLSGAADPIVSGDVAGQLAAQLAEAAATVTSRTLPTGHGLTQMDLQLAAAWLAER
jgi:phospholipase/carboxylesterase